MGMVCFSHGEATWSYREFMGFRQKIINTLYPKSNISFMEINAIGKLYPISEEPVYPFLIHSDCKGEMTTDEMRAVLPQLKYIVTGWDDMTLKSVSSFFKEMGLKLIEGMEEAIERNEPFEFM